MAEEKVIRNTNWQEINAENNTIGIGCFCWVKGCY